MANLLVKILGDANSKTLGRYRRIVDLINNIEGKIEALSQEEMRKLTFKLKEEALAGKNLNELLVEAFSLVREAAKRTLGQRHFDVQLMAGIALHEGKVAQMLTGEGKTLAATTAVFLNALLGKGVHVVTVNDYLARRDTVWMGQ
ncbi:MAG: preprotein translocase subunit SecA, partial [Candidatus Paceibacteria bacterium]